MIPIGDLATAVAVTIFVLAMIGVRMLAARHVTRQAEDEHKDRRDQ